MVAINVAPHAGTDQFLAWMERNGGGPHAYATDVEQKVALDYSVKSLGETVFLDRNHRIAGRSHPPGLDYEGLKKVVDRLVG